MISNISIVGALGAGLLSFLSPCVLPLVPPYLCFLAGVSLDDLTRTDQGQVGRRNWHVVALSFAFVLGFATVFVALGASASLIGKVVTAHFEMLGMIAGLVIIVLGLHFLGIFRIGLLFREARFQATRKRAGYLGAYVVGLAFAFGWTPCIGPILAAILAVAASEQTVAKGAGLLAIYSLGLGIPFLAAAFMIEPFAAFLARFRSYLPVVEKVMGCLLVLTGVAFLTGFVSEASYWLLEAFPALGRIG